MKNTKCVTFIFNENSNSGEQVEFTQINDGDLSTQSLTLNSYGNSVTMNFGGCLFTPEKLRELADLLSKD